jgi:hypothetical protein
VAITFQKRQKEMKRQEKAREKAARREQKKLEKRDKETGGGPPIESVDIESYGPLNDDSSESPN